MLIRCPECLFERNVNVAQIPPTAQLATCPKCRCRFRFREHVLDGDEVRESVAESSRTLHAPQTPAPQNLPEDIPVPEAPRSAPMPDTPARDTALKNSTTSEAALEPFAEHSDKRATPATPRETPPRSPAEAEKSPTGHAPSTAPHTHAAYDTAWDATIPNAVTDHSIAQPCAEILPEPSDPPAGASEAPAGELFDNAAYASLNRLAEETVWQPLNEQEADCIPAPEPAMEKPHRHLGSISDIDDGGKGDIWDAIAAMGGDTDIPPVARSSGYEQAIPWENRGNLSLSAAWRKTVGAVLFSPSRFYGGLLGAGGIAAGLSFYCITVILALLLQTALLYGLLALGDSVPLSAELAPYQAIIATPRTLLRSVGFSLGVALAGLAGATVLCHALVRMVHSRCRPFATTFRIVAYGGATALAGILPVAGVTAGGIWLLLLLLPGVRHAHGLSWKQTLLVVLPIYLLVAGAFFALDITPF